MNTLVPIGTGAAFGFSVVSTFALHLFINHQRGVHHARLFFEVAAIVVTLILMGRWLEARAQTGKRDSGFDEIASENGARRTRGN